MATILPRTITAARQLTGGVELDIDAYPATQVGLMPGWLTGAPLSAQGIETTLPNLPDLTLPPLEPVPYLLRVVAVAPDTVRLTLARPGAHALSDDGCWLGIVTNAHPTPVKVDLAVSDAAIVLTTSRLVVRVERRPLTIAVEDRATGTTVLRSAHRLRQAAGLPIAPPVLADDAGLCLNLELSADEDVLGFGEQFTRLVKNGQRLRLRSEDALGTSTGLAYKPVPVWHSTAGYTGFLNTGAVVDADVGHRRPSVLGLSIADEALDCYLVVDADPRTRLTSYTALTGRPPVPPLWALGYWIGRCRYHSATEMLEVARAARTNRVPCDVLHCDPDWLIVDRLNCDFIWNEKRFGKRAKFVNALAAESVRLSVWELPYLDPASPRHAEAATRGYLLRSPSGRLAEIQKTPTPDGRPRAMLDFTNPDAVAWWQGLHEEFLADGVAVFKTDFGEAVPDDTAPAGDIPPHHLHNLYPLMYNGAVSAAIARYTGRNPLVWGRSGWAGSQRYPGQWGGDAESTVAGMQATLRGGLSYALSAPGYWSHDIGGFYGPHLTPELYVRWTQFGALSPLMRAHGLRPREPWHFGPAVLDIARAWIRLRYELMPYLWQVAHESSSHGWPLLRPLALEFPGDPVAARVDDQFLLGSDLLVVPVLDDGPGPARRRFYLPEGGWTDLLTGERHTGAGHVTEQLPLERIPVLVRDGAVLPRVDIDESVRCTDDLLGRPWTVHRYGGDDRTLDLVGFDGSLTHIDLVGDAVSASGTQPVATQARRI